MPFEFTGKQRSLVIEVQKKGTPVKSSYDGRLALPGFDAITDEQLAFLSDEEFEARLQALYDFIESENPGFDREGSVLNSATRDNSDSCPVPTTTTTTAPITTTTTTIPPTTTTTTTALTTTTTTTIICGKIKVYCLIRTLTNNGVTTNLVTKTVSQVATIWCNYVDTPLDSPYGCGDIVVYADSISVGEILYVSGCVTLGTGSYVWYEGSCERKEGCSDTHLERNVSILEVINGEIISITNIGCTTTTTTVAPPPPTVYYPVYGLLYNWYAATDTRNLASSGWRVPSAVDFEILSEYLGGAPNAQYPPIGGKLKEAGTTYWGTPNRGATNEVGFNARAAGERYDHGAYIPYGENCRFWKSNVYPYAPAVGICRQLRYDANYFEDYLNRKKNYGLSIRLVKNDSSWTEGDLYTGNDGKNYRTVKIGNQVWIADNLVETKYQNGDTIPEVTDNAQWASLTTGAYSAPGNDWNLV